MDSLLRQPRSSNCHFSIVTTVEGVTFDGIRTFLSELNPRLLRL
ncbi:MAG: hypothetical protein OXF06_04690 [Bacteroidetes bacterium]|nr:hypothetical protein [Bacteroidota bacterium]MCY4224113.1 hypothetical protein [Bacteroidota bacterium]